ncbi:M9 family metallopeptidase [Aliivibrio logei]|uniref:M9 family metallopeptidase n=1 Tax=Aliivibrio logei TaxID=688 RepID=UPI0003A2AC37|nr:M9 family metallopeptidase [Aliivibrio logei]
MIINNYISSWYRITPLALAISGSLIAPSTFATELIEPKSCSAHEISLSAQFLDNIENANYECRKSWFSASRPLFESLYSEPQLQRVVHRLNLRITEYTGEDSQANQIENLSEYVRAAYYIRYGFKAELNDYSDQLDAQLTESIQSFIAHPQAMATGQKQANAMYSMIYMIDSIRQLPSIMDSLVTLLDTLSIDNADNWENQRTLNVLFQAMSGHSGIQTYYDHLQARPDYLIKLHQFILNKEWALETQSSFLVTNAAREIGRLLASPHASTRKQVLIILQDLLTRYPLGGKSDKMWVGIAEMLSYFAPDKAKELGLENAKQDLEQRVITLDYHCDGPATIRAQNMTQSQAQTSCEMLTEKEIDFHIVTKSGYRPVNDDLNDTVEIVVFDSNSDYTTYSSFLFGNTTNNGGQYLEGRPSQVDNKARFIAYRQDNNDGFAVLNLEHEYVHYLDGRFNLHGNFNDNLREGYVIWWLEGFAEYMSYKNGYSDAIKIGQNKTYRLTDILATTYSHDTDRIYRWGYLAVRFLIDNHPEEVDTLLALSREGDYKAWAKAVKNIGKQYDNAFNTWLDTVANEESPDKGDIEHPDKPTQPSDNITALNANTTIALSSEIYNEQLFYFDVTSEAAAVSVSISGDGDADVYASFNKIAHYYDYDISNFQRGSEETIRFTSNNANAPLNVGRYYFSVAAREAFEHVELTVNIENEASTTTPAIPSDDLKPVVLNKSIATEIVIHEQRYLVLYVPEDDQTVRIWVNNKSSTTNENKGDINIYAAKDYWPTEKQNEASSTHSGNNEFIEMHVEKASYVYLSMTASQPDNLTEVYVTYE